MNVTTDPLADDYLRRLDAAASALPAHRREELVSEIRDHLQEALRRAPASDETAVRNMLERLGPPEEIAAAATDATPPDQLAAPYRETNAPGDQELSRQPEGLGPGHRRHHPRLDRDRHPGDRSRRRSPHHRGGCGRRRRSCTRS